MRITKSNLDEVVSIEQDIFKLMGDKWRDKVLTKISREDRTKTLSRRTMHKMIIDEYQKAIS